MRLACAATLCGALVLAIDPAAAAAADRVYAVGEGGWSIERFGADVAVLRAALSAGPTGGAGAGLLVLSCDGRERRLRIALPDRIEAGRGDARIGALLIRAPGPATRIARSAVARIAISDGRVLTAIDAGEADGPTLILARLLKAMPARLDLLVSVGAGPVTLSGLSVRLLAPSYRPTDGLAFDDFLSACARGRR